jgi:hypothetical protein
MRLAHLPIAPLSTQCAGDTASSFVVIELYRGRGNFWKRGKASRLMQRVRTSEGLCTSKLFGVLYAIHKRPYPYGRCRKMSGMDWQESTLSRGRFLKLCLAATVAGLSLLSLAGCGGSQGDDGGDGNGNKKDHEDHGGGGY